MAVSLSAQCNPIYLMGSLLDYSRNGGVKGDSIQFIQNCVQQFIQNCVQQYGSVFSYRNASLFNEYHAHVCIADIVQSSRLQRPVESKATTQMHIGDALSEITKTKPSYDRWGALLEYAIGNIICLMLYKPSGNWV